MREREYIFYLSPSSLFPGCCNLLQSYLSWSLPVLSSKIRGRASSHGWSLKNSFRNWSSSYLIFSGWNKRLAFFDFDLGFGSVSRTLCGVDDPGNVLTRSRTSSCWTCCLRTRISEGGISATTSIHEGNFEIFPAAFCLSAVCRTRRAVKLYFPIAG